MSVGTRNQNDAETLFHVQVRKWKFAAKAACGIGSEFRRIWYGMNCLATDSSFFMRRPAYGSLPLMRHAGRARVAEKSIPLLD